MLIRLCGFSSEYNYAPRVVNSFEEKKFVICIPSYNNEKYFKRNLDSVFMQKYKNYRVIYVDDSSKDRTYELVLDYVKNSHYKNKIEVIHNSKNKGAMRNLYDMIHSCSDDEIIITLDGDDWFSHNLVLRRINQAYLDPNVWVTYGTYQHYPGNFVSLNKAVRFEDLKNGRHREMDFMWSHLRTFYAGLFKKIPKELFLDDEGNFLSMAWDVAIMFNLIDMVGEHIYFIPQITYRYNVETPLNDYKVNLEKQVRLEKMIRRRPALSKLEHWEPK